MRLTSLGLLSTIATGKSLFTFTNGKFSTNQRKVLTNWVFMRWTVLGESVRGAKMDPNGWWNGPRIKTWTVKTVQTGRSKRFKLDGLLLYRLASLETVHSLSQGSSRFLLDRLFWVRPLYGSSTFKTVYFLGRLLFRPSTFNQAISLERPNLSFPI